MHDTDAFVRMPALDTLAEQPPLSELIARFEKQCEVSFKDELYVVRDNGAVYRRCRSQRRRRPLDEIWTFGTLNRHSGYFEISGHVVHRIVATAFHGPGPTMEHVVDHIDTNRLNNRADNLRWVTRLENILLNPITRARIAFAYGSLEAFFENPAAYADHNWDWMKVVTKEQAQQSRTRLLAWAEKGQVNGSGTLGDWLFKPKVRTSLADEIAGEPNLSGLRAAQSEALHVPNFASGEGGNRVVQRYGRAAIPPPDEEPVDRPSLTAGAIQRHWRTPTEFPLCPDKVSDDVLSIYLGRLTSGAVFARTQYGESTVFDAAIGPNGVLSVVCLTTNGLKDWTNARVVIEGDVFCHVSGGTFFDRDGAMKAHCLAIGAPTDQYEGSFDDFC